MTAGNTAIMTAYLFSHLTAFIVAMLGQVLIIIVTNTSNQSVILSVFYAISLGLFMAFAFFFLRRILHVYVRIRKSLWEEARRPDSLRRDEEPSESV
jgi:hypothetical protein